MLFRSVSQSRYPIGIHSNTSISPPYLSTALEAYFSALGKESVNHTLFRLVLRNFSLFSRESLNRWIAKQEQVTIGQLADFDFVDLPAVDQYRHMIKAQPKQKLDLSIQTEYPALQTIVYHSKKINAIFASIRGIERLTM